MRDAPVAERVLDATASITVEHGWAAVTMAKVAAMAGVSRQTVYNEYGAKPALGLAMVLRELERAATLAGRKRDVLETGIKQPAATGLYVGGLHRHSQVRPARGDAGRRASASPGARATSSSDSLGRPLGKNTPAGLRRDRRAGTRPHRRAVPGSR